MFKLLAFNSDLNEAITFIRQNPWAPEWPEDQIHRFLTELSSGPGMVLDVHDQRGRAALAVLVDRVRNKTNDAGLQILGMRKIIDPNQAIEQILAGAIERLPAHLAGFQITAHASRPLSADALRCLKPFYYFYEMRREGLKGIEPSARVEAAEPSLELFEVVEKAMADNPDVNLPEFAVWDKNQRRPGLRAYVTRIAGKTVGFATVASHAGQTPEIRTVGVLPEFRARGLGRTLILHALKELEVAGFDACKLSVAVENESALELYCRLGFRELDRYQVHRFVRD